MGGATGVCVCVGGGGAMSPSLLGPAGYRGVQRGGPMKMIFTSTTDSLYSVTDMQQVTEFQLP